MDEFPSNLSRVPLSKFRPIPMNSQEIKLSRTWHSETGRFTRMEVETKSCVPFSVTLNPWLNKHQRHISLGPRIGLSHLRFCNFPSLIGTEIDGKPEGGF